jgi:hypothetical protein
MNERLEKEQFDSFINELSDDSKNLIDIEPAFMYKGQRIRLDFIGKADRLFLNKAFEEIEKDRNDKIDFDQLKRDAEQEILDVKKNMAKIQAKKIISVREFTDIYGDSKTTQQNYRGRMHDPLPYEQKVEGGKVTYIVEKVEQWKANQYK